MEQNVVIPECSSKMLTTDLHFENSSAKTASRCIFVKNYCARQIFVAKENLKYIKVSSAARLCLLSKLQSTEYNLLLLKQSQSNRTRDYFSDNRTRLHLRQSSHLSQILFPPIRKRAPVRRELENMEATWNKNLQVFFTKEIGETRFFLE